MIDQKQDSTPRDPEKIALKAELRYLQEQLERQQETANCLMTQEQMSNMPPKPWGELSIEEKIERTREQVKNLQQQTNYLMGRVEDAHGAARRVNSDLTEHRHDANDGGKVMLPAGNRQKELRESLDSAGCCGNTRDADPAKIYF